MTSYVLTPIRIAPALWAGAAVGAAGVTIWFSLPAFFDPVGAAQIGSVTSAIFFVAIVIWSLGLVVIGGPLWREQHRRGKTAPANALTLGLIATFVAAFALNLLLTASATGIMEGGRVLIEDGHRTVYGWFILFKDCILLSLLGGVVATVIWRIAYRTER